MFKLAARDPWAQPFRPQFRLSRSSVYREVLHERAQLRRVIDTIRMNDPISSEIARSAPRRLDIVASR